MQQHISLEYRFSAAHRCLQPTGWSSIHGHNYKLLLNIVGTPDRNGRLIVEDWLYKEWVEKFLHEATIVSVADTDLLTALAVLPNSSQKTKVIDEQDTDALSIARSIANVFKTFESGEYNYTLVSVTLIPNNPSCHSATYTF